MNILVKNKIIALLILLGLVFFVWWLIIFISRIGLTGINIIAIPEDSTITMNGREIKPGKIYLKPGTYIFTASREYFDKIEAAIDTKDLLVPNTIYLQPKPNSEEALDFLLNNPEIQEEREAASGVESEAIQKKLIEKNPVIESLPHENSRFKIDYSVTDSLTLRYIVTLYPIINGPQDYERYKQQIKLYKQESIKYLEDNGVNIKKSDIVFIPDEE